MAAPAYDAIVVGSGISGGWAAKELCEHGLKVLMLERGENIEHITGYKNATKDPWQFPHRTKLSLENRLHHGVMTRDGFMNGADADMWADDLTCPYVETKPFDWFRGYHVGGRSLLWGRQTYRWSDFDYEANLKEGIAVDWPVRYQDIAPWYDHVESFAGISGSLEGLPQLPDGKFQPPMELNVVEKDVAARIKTKFGGSRRMIIGRCANMTEAKPGRSACQYRDKCRLGCPFGAYFSTQSSTLPAAVATGNLTLRPYSIVTEIRYDKDSRKAKGVTVLDAETNQTIEYNSRIVFLCASTINSAWILMRSATDVWPGGLGSSSGELGHNLMDHHFRVGASGVVEGYLDRILYGRRANGFYIPRYRNLFGDRRDYVRGFGYQGAASRSGWDRDVAELGIGAGLKEALTKPGPWAIGMTGFGEILPRHANRVYLDHERKDKWGLPAPALECELSDNERRMRVDMIDDAVEMLESSGVVDVSPTDSGYIFGQGIHEMGSARMGRDSRTSVLNSHNQVWDARNVFVTDGSFMVSSSCVNPSLSYMAFTARAAHFAAGEMKQGNI